VITKILCNFVREAVFKHIDYLSFKLMILDLRQDKLPFRESKKGAYLKCEPYYGNNICVEA